MALDFKATGKKSHTKAKCRRTKQFKALDCQHISTKKMLVGCHSWEGPHSWITANMERWLSSRVGKPVDMVYSEFLKSYKKSAHGYKSPKDYFDNYVAKSKEELEIEYYYSRFYVSNGILCKRKRKPCWKTNAPTWGKDQIKWNQNNYRFEPTYQDGPIFLGKLWAYIPGFTKKVNVYVISKTKFGLENRFFCPTKEQREFLSEFVPVKIAGIREPEYIYYSDLHSRLSKHFIFIARLSDIKTNTK